MKTQYNKSEIMSQAHKNYRNGLGTWSECLKSAWVDAKADSIDFEMFSTPKVEKKQTYSKSETYYNNKIAVMASLGYDNSQINQML